GRPGAPRAWSPAPPARGPEPRHGRGDDEGRRAGSAGRTAGRAPSRPRRLRPKRHGRSGAPAHRRPPSTAPAILLAPAPGHVSTRRHAGMCRQPRRRYTRLDAITPVAGGPADLHVTGGRSVTHPERQLNQRRKDPWRLRPTDPARTSTRSRVASIASAPP